MQRILALAFPHLALDLVRRRLTPGRTSPPSEPVLVLAEGVAGRSIVRAASPFARQLGIHPGMAVSEAQVLAGDEELRVEPYSEAERDTALASLARWATGTTPIVALDPPDGLLLELAGLERHHAGERELARSLEEQLRAFGLAVRSGVASTIGCARAVARFAPDSPCVVEPGHEQAALAPLPVECLRVDGDTGVALRELAVERVADLVHLPRSRLTSRFGADVLLRLDQALGRAWEVVRPEREVAAWEEGLELAGPVAVLEGVLHATQERLARLLARLEREGLGALALTVEWFPSDAEVRVTPLELRRPTCDGAHVWRLLREKLEDVCLGFGIERIRVHAGRVAPLARAQAVVAGAEVHEAVESPSKELADLLDRLAGRLGEEHVSVPRLLESHVPERAATRHPSADPRAAATRVTAAPRPTCLFVHPERVEVRTAEDGARPVALRWHGHRFEVASPCGPERIARPWWSGEGREDGRRDYWRIATRCGRSLWIFSTHDGKWFVHGEWI